MRRIVVTGMGIVAPNGNTVPDAWQSVLSCKSAVKKISLFDASEFPVQIAAEVSDFNDSEYFDFKELRNTSRVVKFAIAAGIQAAKDAGIDLNPRNAERYGVAIGVGMGALSEIEDNTLLLRDKGYKRISPFFIPYAIPNMPAGATSIRLGFMGPNLCTSTACASGTHAIGEAFNCIKNDVADVMLCGGAESTISPLGIASFNAIKALSKSNENPLRASRPFDLTRDGFVMGEGAGLLMLEELEHATRRGAKIYCELIGYGLSGDAFHITAPPNGHEGGARCMAMALKSGGVNSSDVDYINAHGTSTQLNDKAETKAIWSVFGDHAKNISVSSTKGVTGHCIGAAGGIEAIFLALAVSQNIVPPTANLWESDPECNLDYTPLKPKERKIKTAISNSFGFGGTNATICMRKFT